MPSEKMRSWHKKLRECGQEHRAAQRLQRDTNFHNNIQRAARIPREVPGMRDDPVDENNLIPNVLRPPGRNIPEQALVQVNQMEDEGDSDATISDDEYAVRPSSFANFGREQALPEFRGYITFNNAVDSLEARAAQMDREEDEILF